MKSVWKDYKIGNGLRGTIKFKARNHVEAWNIGRKRFNKWMCDEHGNRMIYLEKKHQLNYEVLVTPWVKKQMKLPIEKRHFHEFEISTPTCYVLVAQGMSGEELVSQ